MTRLNKILNPGGGRTGWNAADFAPEGIYGVSVRPAQVSGAKAVVEKVGFVDGGVLASNSLEALSRQLTPGLPWTVPLSRKAYNILVVAEPAVKPEEMTESVRWSIGSMIDYPVADADITWMRIPTRQLQPSRPPHLYVMAARREITAEHQAAFKQARLDLRALDVRETAHRNMAALIEKPGEGVALLSVGSRGVQFTVTFRGELYLDRFVDETGFSEGVDETARERARERVVLQVQRSLDFISRTLPFIDINRVVLAPTPESLDFRAYFAEQLPVAVESYDLAAALDFTQVPELASGEIQSSCFVALGAALRFMDSTS